MKQFYHQEHEYADARVSSANRFQYKGKEVLLAGFSKPLLVVAGFISGEVASQKEGFRRTAITDIEPIIDEAQREELSGLLRAKVTNKDAVVIFWDN